MGDLVKPPPPGRGFFSACAIPVNIFIAFEFSFSIINVHVSTAFFTLHGFVLSPRPADRAAFESTLSNCVFVLTSYPHGDTLHIGVCELVCFNPFCNVL